MRKGLKALVASSFVGFGLTGCSDEPMPSSPIRSGAVGGGGGPSYHSTSDGLLNGVGDFRQYEPLKLPTDKELELMKPDPPARLEPIPLREEPILVRVREEPIPVRVRED